MNNERTGGTIYVLAYHTTLDDRCLVRAPALREPKHNPGGGVRCIHRGTTVHALSGKRECVFLPFVCP